MTETILFDDGVTTKVVATPITIDDIREVGELLAGMTRQYDDLYWTAMAKGAAEGFQGRFSFVYRVNGGRVAGAVIAYPYGGNVEEMAIGCAFDADTLQPKLRDLARAVHPGVPYGRSVQKVVFEEL